MSTYSSRAGNEAGSTHHHDDARCRLCLMSVDSEYVRVQVGHGGGFEFDHHERLLSTLRTDCVPAAVQVGVRLENWFLSRCQSSPLGSSTISTLPYFKPRPRDSKSSTSSPRVLLVATSSCGRSEKGPYHDDFRSVESW